MKITKIEVKKLFGIFNHEIPLNTRDHITIIHGPNGYGKTILLTLLNAIFNSQYSKLRTIPFSELLIYFDNKMILYLKKNGTAEDEKRKKSRDSEQLQIEFQTPGTKSKANNFPLEIAIEDIPYPLGMLDDTISGLERIGSSTWLYLPTREKLSLSQVFERFAPMLPFPVKLKSEPPQLKKIKKSLNINFIETQRLLNVSDSYNSPRTGLSRSSRPMMLPMLPAVTKYSEELSLAIQEKLAEYGSISQSLDRTFPTRLVKSNQAKYPTIDELKSELNALEEKRSQLIAAGLLDKQEEIEFKDFQKIDNSNINVLSVYIQDVKQKLKVFNELTQKIDLLIKIINSRFLHKRLSINKRDGFIFKNTEGKIIPPTGLSSGEQHELVLLYELLFKVKSNSLILIDEPEISLHVAWQQEFLKDLQEITRLVGFDVLIATHSPQIINDRWDLTVELKGPNQ